MTNQKAIKILQTLKHTNSDETAEAVDMAVRALQSEAVLKPALYKRCGYNCNAGPIGQVNDKCIGFSHFFSKDAKNNLCLTCPIHAE